MIKKQTTLILALAVLSANADVKSIAGAKIIYGADNRIETYQASQRDQELASSTAGMIENSKLIQIGDKFMLPPTSIKDSMGLCSDERFSEQPSSVICSGFLVGPNLLVTAGHCVTSQARCEDVSFVFDYKVNKETKRANMLVDSSDVYKCEKVLDAKLENVGVDKKDYALVRLERVVSKKQSLEIRTEGAIEESEELVIIGHPSGLPQKVSDGANVFENDLDKSYFKTNLDSFGGNSGSAVFNNRTGVVEGILVRGARDYKNDQERQCIVVYEAPNDITGIRSLGESVSRITDIPTLKYKDSLLNVETVEELEKLLTLGVHLDMTSEDLNTLVHMAAKKNNSKLIKFLADKGADLNLQNKNGETALHIAAFENSKAAIYQLVKSGANTLIKDNFGVYPSERTNYLAFAVRRFLRRVQQKQQNQ